MDFYQWTSLQGASKTYTVSVKYSLKHNSELDDEDEIFYESLANKVGLGHKVNSYEKQEITLKYETHKEIMGKVTAEMKHQLRDSKCRI